MASVLDNLKKISPGPKRFAAVDFDRLQLRVVHAERVGGRTRILKLAAVAMPETADPEDPKAVGRLLATTLRDLRLGNVGVLMNIGRGEAVLKPVTLPPGTDPNDLANMVQFQVEKELPFRPEEAVIDFTVETHYDAAAAQGEQAQAAGIDVLVGAAKLPVVAHYRQVAEAADVKLLRLGLRSYANVRCIDTCTQRGAGEKLLLVHLGADETEIDMLTGKSLSFSRSAAVKIASPEDPAAQAESVRALVMEVARSVQSLQAVEGETRIDAILVAGGTGAEGLAAREISRRLGVRCEQFDPSKSLGLGDVENPSAFISALGLAIGHSGADQLPFDFLNPKRPRVERNWAKITAAAVAAFLVLAVAGGVTAASIQIGREQDAVDKLTAEINKIKEQQRKRIPLKKRQASIRQWVAESRDWLSHWGYLSALFPSCGDAYIGPLRTSGDGSISFNVKARESKILTDVGKRLTEAGYRYQPGRLTTAKDPWGYPYNTEVKVLIAEELAVDLRSVKPIPRPEDDDSINHLMGWAKEMERVAAATGGSATASTPSTPKPAPAPAPAPTGSTKRGPDERKLEELRRDLLRKYDRDKNGRLDSREMKYAYRGMRDAYRLFEFDGQRGMSSEERRARDRFYYSLQKGR